MVGEAGHSVLSSITRIWARTCRTTISSARASSPDNTVVENHEIFLNSAVLAKGLGLALGLKPDMNQGAKNGRFWPTISGSAKHKAILAL